MSFRSRLLRYSYWIIDWMKGSPIRREYRDIKKIMRGSEFGHNIKEEKLKDILAYAIANCPFYSSCDVNDLSSFPVVNKAILIDNFERVKVPEMLIPGQCGKVHVQSTSGSTGTPFRVPQDTVKRNRRIAELKYFGEIVGFKSHEPLCQLRIWTKWQSKTRMQSFKENIYPFNIADMSDDNLENLVEIINSKKIVSLRSYASSYKMIADFVNRKDKLLPSLKICIAGSEALGEDVRNAVLEYMKCDIISQYADEECGILGQESIQGDPDKFYLNHASYHFEVLKMNSDKPADYGELGRIVITDLTNRAFPIIRYDTGDIAVMEEANSMSAGYPYFSALYGRRLDLIYNVDGEPVHPMVLNRVMKNFGNIIQWQFIQKSEKGYTLKLNVSDDVDERGIILELKRYFGNEAKITIDYVTDIPVLKSGKRKSVANEWKN